MLKRPGSCAVSFRDGISRLPFLTEMRTWPAAGAFSGSPIQSPGSVVSARKVIDFIEPSTSAIFLGVGLHGL